MRGSDALEQRRGSGSQATRELSHALFSELGHADTSEERRVQCREELVQLHLPLVDHCARRFTNRGEPLDDLVQVGTIGLIKSVDRFDTDRGVEFSTYATPTIIGEIKRYFRDKGWAIRVPRRLQELRMSISSVTGDMSQELGRSPTPREIADKLGVTRRGGDGGHRVGQRLLDALARCRRQQRRALRQQHAGEPRDGRRGARTTWRSASRSSP